MSNKPTLYASLLGGGGLAIATAVTGLPTLQGVEPEWFADKIAHALAIGAGVFGDAEDWGPPTIGYARVRAAAKVAAAQAYATRLKELGRQIRAAADPTRLVGMYSDLPVGQRWQYDDDQSTYVGDNVRTAALGPLDAVDVNCTHAYLDISDLDNMTRERAHTYAVRRIAAARLYGRRVILFVCPQWTSDAQRRDVPSEILAGIYQAAAEAGVDVCLWCDGCDEASAKRYADEGRAQVAATGVAQ